MPKSEINFVISDSIANAYAEARGYTGNNSGQFCEQSLKEHMKSTIMIHKREQGEVTAKQQAKQFVNNLDFS